MKMAKETENQIKELQSLEQGLQSVLMQKQTFQLELSEIENALKEIEKSGGEVYKIAGNIMVKTTKEETNKDLKEKKDLINLRFKAIETQEKELTKTSEDLRKKVLASIKKE